MKAVRFFNGWTLAALLLVLVIIAGGGAIWVKSSRSQPIEIALSPYPQIEGQIYVGGGVNNPGIYPFFAGDAIDDIIRAAGGLKDGADLSKIELTIVAAEEGETPQKIDINQAEAWLLAALPGVGEVKALAIIEYRQQNGPFRDVNELGRVPGFGDIILERLKNLITVND